MLCNQGLWCILKTAPWLPSVNTPPYVLLVAQVAFKTPNDTTYFMSFNAEWQVWESTKRNQCLHTAQYYGIAICTGSLVPALMMELGECTLEKYARLAWAPGAPGLSVAELQRIAFDLLVGLEELHICHYAHRDCKPGNAIMVGPKRTTKLIDFGSFKYLDDVQTGKPVTMIATFDYAPPELLIQTYMKTMRQSHGVKIDSWSWGATFLFMATNKAPWAHLMEGVMGGRAKRLEVLERKVREKGMEAVLADYPRPRKGGPLGEWLGKEGMEVLVGALQWDLENRCTSAELLKHTWFKQHRQKLAQQVEALQAFPGPKQLRPDAAPSLLVKSWKEEGLV